MHLLSSTTRQTPCMNRQTLSFNRQLPHLHEQTYNLWTDTSYLSVSGVTYTIITRCLHEGEDIVVQHFAAKTIENVASTHGRHCNKFATNDTAQVRTEYRSVASSDCIEYSYNILNLVSLLCCRYLVVTQHCIA